MAERMDPAICQECCLKLLVKLKERLLLRMTETIPGNHRIGNKYFKKLLVDHVNKS